VGGGQGVSTMAPTRELLYVCLAAAVLAVRGSLAFAIGTSAAASTGVVRR
jgi:hypothetical protein